MRHRWLLSPRLSHCVAMISNGPATSAMPTTLLGACQLELRNLRGC